MFLKIFLVSLSLYGMDSDACKKSRLYTRQGDTGMTSLGSGEKVLKSSSRVDTYGDLDELASTMGLLRASLLKKTELKEYTDYLFEVQKEIFTLSSLFAFEKSDQLKYNLPRLEESSLKKLESAIDRMDASLPPLHNFIIPGGSKLSAKYNHCRTVCRRAERKAVAFFEENPEEVDAIQLKFLNRLSDYFFVMVRKMDNIAGVPQEIWSK